MADSPSHLDVKLPVRIGDTVVGHIETSIAIHYGQAEPEPGALDKLAATIASELEGHRGIVKGGGMLEHVARDAAGSALRALGGKLGLGEQD